MSNTIKSSLKCCECNNVSEGYIVEANIYFCPKCGNMIFGRLHPKNTLYKVYKQYKKLGRDMRIESKNLIQLSILCDGLKGLNRNIKLEVDRLIYITNKNSFLVYLGEGSYNYNIVCSNGLDIREYKNTPIHKVAPIFSSFLQNDFKH